MPFTDIQIEVQVWAFDLAIKTLLGTRAGHVQVPELQAWLNSLFYLPPEAYPGRQQIVIQVLGSLPPI